MLAEAGELIEESLRATGFAANGMRAKLPAQLLVVGDHLPLVEDGLANQWVCVGRCHGRFLL
jgi:hypothetical protein